MSNIINPTWRRAYRKECISAKQRAARLALENAQAIKKLVSGHGPNNQKKQKPRAF